MSARESRPQNQLEIPTLDIPMTDNDRQLGDAISRGEGEGETQETEWYDDPELKYYLFNRASRSSGYQISTLP